LHDIFASQDIQVINAGVAGDRSNEMLARFEKDILGPKPDLITISVGVNDVWRGFSASNPKGDGPEGIPLDEFRKNVESIVSQGTAAGATVIVLSGTPIGENMQNPANVKAKDYNDALKDIASTHHLLFVDLQKPFRTLIADYRKTTGASDFFLTVDGIHMNDDGNLVMAHTLLTALGITPEMQQSVERHVFEEEQSQP
jgi:lysophospholipase L1-like esterase